MAFILMGVGVTVSVACMILGVALYLQSKIAKAAEPDEPDTEWTE